MTRRHHVPKRIMEALEASGDYSIRRGKRHLRLYVKGEFVGVTPHCVSGDGRTRVTAELNVLASIKRASR